MKARRGYDNIYGYPANVLNQSTADTYNQFAAVYGVIPSLIAIRSLFRRSSILQSMVTQIGANVVGTDGPQPTFNNVTNRYDREHLADWWKEWQCNVMVSGDCTSWAEFLTAMESEKFLTGRSFGIFRRHPDYPKGIALMTVSRESVPGWGYGQTDYINRDGYEVINGTAFSDSGRIAGYYFHQRLSPQEIVKQGNIYGYQYRYGQGAIFVPEGDVLDYRSFTLVDDWDGYPYMILPVLFQLGRIFRLDNAVLEGMEAAARKMGFIEKPEGMTPIQWEDQEDWAPPAEKMQGNHIEDLPPGYSFKGFDPSTPNNDQRTHRQEYLKNACSGAGVDYASASGDLSGVNFSSMRHGVLTSRDNYRNRQRRLVNRVCRKSLGVLLDHAANFGGLKLKGSVASIQQAKQTDFQCKSWEWIDPLKDAAASQILLKMGVTSPQKIASGLGVEYNSIIQDIAEAVAQLEKAKLTPEIISGLAGEVVPPQPMEGAAGVEQQEDMPDEPASPEKV